MYLVVKKRKIGKKRRRKWLASRRRISETANYNHPKLTALSLIAVNKLKIKERQ